MSNNQVNEICFFCNKCFQFGHGSYKGRKIVGYEIMVCNSCYEVNWDGWSPHLEYKLLKYLENSGIPVPQRNSQGWFPREY